MKKEFYECAGKEGPVYEKLGLAVGAGSQKENMFIVYRQFPDGGLYFRTIEDFKNRMVKVDLIAIPTDLDLHDD